MTCDHDTTHTLLLLELLETGGSGGLS